MSWSCFISAIYWKLHTCVAWQLSSSWLLISSFSKWLFCTQYKKIDKILRPLGARISPLLKSLHHHFMCVLCVLNIQWIMLACIYLLKVNKRNTKTRCKICSKLTIKIPERRQCRRFGIFIVNFEHIAQLILVFLLLTLSR